MSVIEKPNTAARPAPARLQPILEKYLAILEIVVPATDGLSLSGVAERVGLPKATVHRLLGALCGTGLVSASGEGRKSYRHGPRLTSLLRLLISPGNIEPLVRPVLRKLVDQFGETAFLAQLTDCQVCTVAMVTPDKDWQGHVHPGRIMPPAAASAKAILAFQTEDMLRKMLQPPFPRFTPKTLTTRRAMDEALNNVRHTGLASCIEEIDPGQVAYACPVHLKNAGVIFSICIVGPTARMTSQPIPKIHDALANAATEFTMVLESRFSPGRVV